MSCVKYLWLILVVQVSSVVWAEAKLYPDRWFYCSRQVQKEVDVEFYADLIAKAQRGGYRYVLRQREK